MCLNAEVNYENLQNTYDLNPYYGLRKATPLEKELKKRNNVLLKAFGEPILYGRWGPFDRTSKAKQKTDEDITSGEKAAEPRIKTSSKVIFRHISLTEDRYDRVYMKKDVSDDYSVKLGGTSPTVSLISNASVAELLDEDPFDYEIVNIDTKLLKVPRVISRDYEPKSQSDRLSTITEFETKLKRRTSVMSKKQEETNKINYSGEPNAFIIELFGCREDVDYKQSLDFLEAAFVAMKDYDYCIIRVPCTERSFPLLQHFCCIPAKPNVCSKYALYIAHRNAILGKLRVRKAELIDIPLIAQLLNTLDVKETMWTVENTVHKRNESIFVLLCGCSLVGLGILEKAEQTDYLQNKYNIDSYRIQKYHYQSNGIFAGFSALKTVLIYPVFEVHFRFFSREMMRLSECTTLVWMTAYRNKWVAHKANTLAIAMIPLVPRGSEVDCVSIPEIKKLNTISNSLEAFSTWFISKKFTTVPKVNVDTRIVIVGASRTTMAFLNALLFSDSCTYLTFTNVTLISPSGLPYVRHSKALVENMFLKCRTNTDRYLKSVPYSYYVNIIQGTMTEIHRRAKYVGLANGNKYNYDLLFLLFGKQYQHPTYMKTILDREDKMKKGLIPIYTPLDVPICARERCFSKKLPENVFIINNLSDANKALKYIRNNLMYFDPYCILVYGATIHAYCCLSTMLQMGVPSQNIVFVEPFPSEDPKKPRISVFANVDRTVNDMLKNLNIKTYSSYYFESWSCDFDYSVTSVTFMSQFEMVQVPCSAFFYYGKQGVDEDAFVAINKSGIAYNEGILIDHQFRTRDASIYAAGPATRYNSNYYADDKQQRYYDSYEVGTKLGNQIRNQLDPLFVDMDKYVKRTESNNEDSGSTFSSKESPSVSSNEFESKTKLPDFKEPRVMYCTLPGGLQYLEVRSPGKKIPCHYIQSLHYNGEVIETFKEGYFKLHFNKDFIVDGITCLTPEKRPLENFVRLYGQSSVVLNNVILRCTAKKLDNLYAFFRSPWAYFLYHDKSEELFAIVKELLPKGQRKGKTLKEALYSAAERLSSTSCTETLKSEMRSVFESSPHVEAIIDYVMEWLSEHEALLPVYLQPWHQAEYAHDEQTNPKIHDPLPKRVTGRDMVVEKESYKTTTGEYCVKPNPNKAMERSDCACNCKRVIYMTGVEKRLQSKNIVQPRLISEMKDNYRGLTKSPLAPPEIEVKAPDPEYIFDVVASGRSEAPVIPETAGGFRRLLDPYVTTYREKHRLYTPDDQYGIGAKDHITFYTESNTPKVRGFGPKYKEIWMPLEAKVHRAVYDRSHVKKEYHEVAACHNPVNNLKGVFQSETKKQFTPPFASELASWSHGEEYFLAPYPPNPYQTNIAPFMYCSDYCHISQGTKPCIVIDQLIHDMTPHKLCKQRFSVSRGW
ncbi:Uncharacterized protein C20orf26-like [Papilio xuthus]|uniref:Uncharacterized protein C20orf26-like n=1 Tax=Papilio xuthus TaxID=66420 RepID=A0A194PHU0_PAPXU|nr:Uncharacterized protein C20orf26-like [Papilio xuthus]